MLICSAALVKTFRKTVPGKMIHNILWKGIKILEQTSKNLSTPSNSMLEIHPQPNNFIQMRDKRKNLLPSVIRK